MGGERGDSVTGGGVGGGGGGLMIVTSRHISDVTGPCVFENGSFSM